MATPASSTFSGWFNDRENSRLDYYYSGTKVGHMTGTTFVLATNIGMTITDTGLTVTAGGLTVTAGGLTVTAGNIVGTAAEIKIGAPAVFASTQGVGDVHMGGSSLGGIAPVGATVTSGAVFASDTVCRKIIAAGTASNIET